MCSLYQGIVRPGFCFHTFYTITVRKFGWAGKCPSLYWGNSLKKGPLHRSFTVNRPHKPITTVTEGRVSLDTCRVKPNPPEVSLLN